MSCRSLSTFVLFSHPHLVSLCCRCELSFNYRKHICISEHCPHFCSWLMRHISNTIPKLFKTFKNPKFENSFRGTQPYNEKWDGNMVPFITIIFLHQSLHKDGVASFNVCFNNNIIIIGEDVWSCAKKKTFLPVLRNLNKKLTMKSCSLCRLTLHYCDSSLFNWRLF